MPEKDPSGGAASLPDAVEADISGVQGGEGAPVTVAPASPSPPEDVSDVPPADAGEIEWVGTVLKKPPHPNV